jgi:hypothetical protein
MVFEKCIKKIQRTYIFKNNEKKWFKGAHVAPYNVFGPGYF